MIGLHEIYRIDETKGNVKRLLHLPDDIIEKIYEIFPRDDMAWVVARQFRAYLNSDSEDRAGVSDEDWSQQLWQEYTRLLGFKSLVNMFKHDRSGEVVKLIDSLFNEKGESVWVQVLVAEKIVIIRDIFGLKISDAKRIYDVINSANSYGWTLDETRMILKIFSLWIKQDPSRRPNEMWMKKFLDTYSSQLQEVFPLFPRLNIENMDFDEVMNMLLSDEVDERHVVDVPGGYTHWVELMNAAARAREAARMIHCGAAVGRMFSLRNADDDPNLTVEIERDELVQARVMRNGDVGNGFVPSIAALCRKIGVRRISFRSGLTRDASAKLFDMLEWEGEDYI